MADVQSNINVNVNTSQALANIKALQREISKFHSGMASSNAANAASAAQLRSNLVSTINQTGKFSAQMTTIRTTAESFTNALEKNKLSLGQYFRFAGASTKTFGRLFKTEFNTIEKVARERVKDLQTQYVKMGRDASGAMQAIKVRPLTLDMQNYGTQVAMAAQRQQIFNQLIRQGSTNLLNFGKNTQWAGRQLMVGFTVPLTMLGSVAVREFQKIEQQAVKFRRVYGDMFTTTAQTDKALTEVRELAEEFTKYGIAVEKTIELSAKVAQMGNVGQALEQQVIQATRLSILGGMDQMDALDTTIGLTNAFGVAIEDLAEKINFLNAAENQTILAIQDFNTAVPLAGSVVQQLGGSVEDLAFFLTAMREGGINASQGANALKSSLARLISPTRAAQERLGAMGIDVLAIVEKNAGDLRGTVMELGYALDELDPLTKARAIETLFGRFQFARMSTLFQNIVDEGSQANRVLQLTQASAAELAILAERELKRVEDSPAFRFQKTFEQLKATLAPLGESFMKAIIPLAEAITEVLKKFNNLSDGAKQIITNIIMGLGIFAPAILMVFGLMANGIANVIKGFANLANFINRFGVSSRVVGQQTNYMTSEQLRAQAVAASLDQVHQKLAQTFTAEAAAVNSLTAAYSRSIAAQRAFGGGLVPGGRVSKLAGGKKVPGYKDGVIKVPGPQGAGDIVPAMLSPGEAVIPAKMARKYGGFINAMIDDKVPGFSRGRGVQAGGYGEFAIFIQNLLENTSQRKPGRMDYRQVLAPLGIRAGEASGLVPSPANLNAGVFDKHFKELEGISKKFTTEYNKQLTNLSGKVKDSATLSARAWTNAGKAVESEIGKVSSPSTRKVLRRAFGLDQDYINTTPTQSRSGSGRLDRARQQIFRAPASEARSYTRIRPTLFAAARRLGFGKGEDLSVGHPMGQKPIKINPEDKNLTKSVRDAISANKQNSAAKKKNTSATNEAAAASKNLAREETRSAATERARNATRLRDPSTGRFISEDRARSMGILPSPGRPGLSGNMVPDPGRPGRMIDANRLPARLRALQRLEGMGAPAPAQAPPRRFGAGAAMGAGGVLVAGTMAASMAPGQIGETAQKLMMPAFALSMVLPLLTNKFGAVIVILGALVAAVVAAKMSFNKAQKESIAMAKAMEGGTKSVRAFAEMTGRVSAGELRDRERMEQRTQYAIGTDDQSFGSIFMDSEQGKKILEAAGKSIASVGPQASAGQVAAQLSTAVVSGALDISEARSVAANLAKELGNTSFGIEINAEITRLLGPNGERLESEPLKVFVDLMDQTTGRLEDVATRIASSPSFLGREFGSAIGAAAAGGITGALAGGKLGGIFGSALGPKGTAAGAILGGGIGAATGTILGSIERNRRIGTETGAFVAIAGIAMQRQKEILDSLDVEYQKRIENARVAGEMEEVERLTNERLEARAQILERTRDLNQSIINAYESASPAVQKALLSGAEKSVLSQFEGTPLEDVAKLALGDIKASGLSREQQLLLTVKLQSGDIDPISMIDFIDTFKSSGNLQQVVDLIVNMDSATADQVMFLANQFGGQEETLKFLAFFESNTDVKEIEEYLDTFLQIQKMGDLVNVSAYLDFYVNNEEQFRALQEDLKNIRAQEVVDVTFAASVIGADALAAMNLEADFFTNLAPLETKEFLSVVTTMYRTIGTPAFDAQYQAAVNAGFVEWSKERGRTGSQEEFIANQATRALKAQRAAAGATAARGGGMSDDEMDTGGSGGGGGGTAEPIIPASVLDNVLQKLRDVSSATVKLTKGWIDARLALDKIGSSGKTMFNGLQQSMRRLGAGEDLIALIAGMDPEEYEKRKEELFVFDSQGNIVQFRQSLVSIGEALRQITLGEFESAQQKNVKNVQNQTVAVRKLVAAGMSYTEAYKAVEDAAFAAAIAQEKNNDVIKETIKNAEDAAKAVRDFAAAQAVAQANAETADNRAILEFIQANRGLMSNAQAQAILQDRNLQRLVLNPSIDPETLQQALDDAADRSDLDLDIKKLTIEGLEEIFSDGFGKAMDAFSAKEEEINIQFRIDTQADSDLIRQAESQIAAIMFEIDDLDAELKRIGDKEQEINDLYDERIKALDKVERSLDAINKLKRSQLSVADALSRGDIAAAAAAAQTLRAEQAEASVSERRNRLEQARENELNAIVGQTGKTRKQIEEEIKKLKDQIFDIEEETLEPAQERVRLAEEERQRRIDSLTVLGKTKIEWQQIDNNIKLARTSSDSYTSAMQSALGVVGDIVNHWTELDGKEPRLSVTADLEVDEETVIDAISNIAPSIEPFEYEVRVSGGSDVDDLARSIGGLSSALADLGETWDEDFDVEDIIQEPAPGWPYNQGWFQFLTAMWNIIGPPIEEAFNKIREKVVETWEKFKEWFEDLRERFPIIDEIASAFETALENIQNAWETFKENWNRITSALSSVWDLLFGTDESKSFEENVAEKEETINKIIDYWKDQIGLADLWEKFKGIGEWLEEKWEDAKKWFSDIPTKVANAAGDLWANVKGIREWLEEKWSEAGSWLGGLPGRVAGKASNIWEETKGIGPWLQEKWSEGSGWLGGLSSKVSESAQNIWSKVDGIKEWFDDKWTEGSDWVSDLPNKISREASEVWDGVSSIGEWMEDSWSEAQRWLANLPYKIGFALGYIWENVVMFGDWLSESWDNALEWFAELPERISEAAQDIWSGILDFASWLEEKWELSVEWFAELPEKISSLAGNIWEGVVTLNDWLEEKWADAVSWLTSVPSRVSSAASDFWSETKTIRDWLQEKWNEAVTWVQEIPERIRNTASDWWNATKPLLVWFEEKWLEAVDWVRDIPNKVRSAASDWWENVKPMLTWLGEQWNRAVDWVRDIPNKVRSAASDWWSRVKTLLQWAREKWNEAVSWFRNLPNLVRAAAGNIWNNIQNMSSYLAARANELRDWIRGLPNKIRDWARGIWDGFWQGFTDGRNAAANRNDGGIIRRNNGGGVKRYSPGGAVDGFGNYDNVPALLTPGEFVIRREMVNKYGQNFFANLNSGIYDMPSLRSDNLEKMQQVKSYSYDKPTQNTSTSSSVYNSYSVSVNVAKTDSDPNDIARAVMKQIKRIDSQQIRGNRI